MCLEYLRSSEGFSPSIRLCISNQWLLRSTKHQRSNAVYAVKCSEECEDLYIGATKQSLYRRMAQHRRANSSGQDSAIFLHLQQKKHHFHDHEVRILDREERWFERGVKEVIHVKVEHLSLNRGGGLRHLLSHAYDAVLQGEIGVLRSESRRSTILSCNTIYSGMCYTFNLVVIWPL